MNDLIADFRTKLAECKSVPAVERLVYETWQQIQVGDSENNTLVANLGEVRKKELRSAY